MAMLIPYLLGAISIPLSVIALFVFFSVQYPISCAIIFCLFCAYQQWYYNKKRTSTNLRSPSNWVIPHPVYCLRTGDPIVDELVQDGALTRAQAKYSSIVQLIKEKIKQHEDEEGQGDPKEAQKRERHIELFQRLLKQIETVPNWVDEKKLERASDLYRHNVVLISAGLSVALVESYAFPTDAEVLFISGGLTTSREGTVRRLMETGVWVFSVLKEAIKVGNPGFSALINVRFLHAFARKKCLDSEKWRAECIPVDENAPREELMKEVVKGRIEGEMPINQATMCATLFLFCHVCMEVAQLRGAPLSDEDKECYWHYWRYCGYLLGIEDSIMPLNYFDGLAARRSPLYKGRQRPNKQSQTLSKDTIESYNNLPHIPFHQALFIVTLRKFLGDSLCNELGVPSTTLEGKAQWWTAYGFFVLCYVLNSLCAPVKALFATCFVRYINNAFYHFFVLDAKSEAELPKSSSTRKCPFGF